MFGPESVEVPVTVRSFKRRVRASLGAHLRAQVQLCRGTRFMRDDDVLEEGITGEELALTLVLRKDFRVFRVVTWGDQGSGGDMGAAARELSSGVTAVYSTRSAFAALKEDGRVVAWGSAGHGGDSSEVAGELLDGVVKVYSIDRAFAAIKQRRGCGVG